MTNKELFDSRYTATYSESAYVLHDGDLTLYYPHCGYDPEKIMVWKITAEDYRYYGKGALKELLELLYKEATPELVALVDSKLRYTTNDEECATLVKHKYPNDKQHYIDMW